MENIDFKDMILTFEMEWIISFIICTHKNKVVDNFKN
jgi:hypothetical protein